MDKARIIKIPPMWLFVALGAMVWWFAIGSHTFTQHTYDIVEVDVPQAKDLIDAGAVVIDARGESAYEGRHIPGALLIPLAVLRAGIPDELLGFKDREVVVYCSKGRHIGPEATQILNQAGFASAVNLTGGIGGWAEAGQAVESG